MIHPLDASTARLPVAAARPLVAPNAQGAQIEEKFQEFVAGTFFQQMLKEMRKSVHEPAYMHGGQMETAFQAQMDQTVAEDLARNFGDAFSGDLFRAYVEQGSGQSASRTRPPSQSKPNPAGQTVNHALGT